MPKKLPLTPRLTDPAHDLWCWAAVASTVGEFKDKRQWAQCVIAQRTLGNEICCNPGQCNQPAELDAALEAVDHFLRMQPGTIDFDDIVREIEGDRPVGVRIGWTGGGIGHFVAVIGYDETTGMIDVADPLHRESSITVATLESSYKGLGNWTHTYFTF